MSEVLSPLAFQLGMGGIGGFIVGYAVKKISKLVAVVIGLFLIALLYLSTQGIISINFSALLTALEGWVGSAGGAFSWLVGLLSIIPFAGSFGVGFFLGFKLG